MLRCWAPTCAGLQVEKEVSYRSVGGGAFRALNAPPLVACEEGSGVAFAPVLCAFASPESLVLVAAELLVLALAEASLLVLAPSLPPPLVCAAEPMELYSAPGWRRESKSHPDDLATHSHFSCDAHQLDCTGPEPRTLNTI